MLWWKGGLGLSDEGLALLITFGRQLAHSVLEPTPYEFNGAEVGGIGRQKQQFVSRFLDGVFEELALVYAGIVQHQHAVFGQTRQQPVFGQTRQQLVHHKGLEQKAVPRS